MMPASEAYELAKATRAELEPRKVKELLVLIEKAMLKEIEKGFLNLCVICVHLEGIDGTIIDLTFEAVEKMGYKISRPSYGSTKDQFVFTICWNPTPKSEDKIGPYTLVKNNEPDTIWQPLLNWVGRKLGF